VTVNFIIVEQSRVRPTCLLIRAMFCRDRSPVPRTKKPSILRSSCSTRSFRHANKRTKDLHKKKASPEVGVGAQVQASYTQPELARTPFELGFLPFDSSKQRKEKQSKKERSVGRTVDLKIAQKYEPLSLSTFVALADAPDGREDTAAWFSWFSCKC
jgi:hypothetical protein